jgi:hypothetical protein
MENQRGRLRKRNDAADKNADHEYSGQSDWLCLYARGITGNCGGRRRGGHLHLVR